MNRNITAALIAALAFYLVAFGGCISGEQTSKQPEPWNAPQAPQAEPLQPALTAGTVISTQEEATEEIVEISDTISVLISELEGIDSEI